MDTLVQLPVHNHPLYPSSQLSRNHCKGCYKTSPIYGGYRCNDYECDHVSFHKECAESSPEINHPSHSEHPLLLTQYKEDRFCDVCGLTLRHVGYHCSICDFDLDLACARKAPPLLSIEDPMLHGHPLILYKEEVEEEVLGACQVCKKMVYSNKVGATYPYACLKCDIYIHMECVNIAIEVNHPCHSNHRLKFLTYESLPIEAHHTCLLCGSKSEGDLYHCSVCNFSICVACSRNPLPLFIEHPETHEHKLALFSRFVEFICNVCGMEGHWSPFVCTPCGFVVHQTCIDLPRLININRHDHRISFTHHLGHGYIDCGVCHKSIKRHYGAYSCSICSNYAVHSQCAIDVSIWDGIELQGIPEEYTEDLTPFQVVGENLIKHFSHEKHILRLEKDNITLDERKRCQACMYPVYYDPIYSCEVCDFVLHEKCANLPKKRRSLFSNRQLTLRIGANDSDENMFRCVVCQKFSNGFRYETFRMDSLDVRCGSFSEPLDHDGHKHLLYYNAEVDTKCMSCHKEMHSTGLSCERCSFNLDIYCATLPKIVKHKYDEHPLSLSHGEKASGKYWCDICERELNPHKWFYTCFDCGVTLHVDCVFGDFYSLMPGSTVKFRGCMLDVVSNDRNSRPICSGCNSRCNSLVILKIFITEDAYICSLICLRSYLLLHLDHLS